MSRPVQIGALALRDIGKARTWLDRQQEGLGETFLARVDETIQRVEQNPEQYQVKLLDLRQAPVRPIQVFNLVLRCAGFERGRGLSERPAGHRTGKAASDASGGADVTAHLRQTIRAS